MANTTITSANSILTMVVPGLFPVPVSIQGYSTDDAFMLDALDLAETVMGVDGKMSAGYVPKEVKLTITLQADSDSKGFFAILTQAVKTAREIFYMSATLSLPSTGEAFTFTRGILTSVDQAPAAKKMLQPQKFVITWESVNRAIL